jgi:uncharacterized membrane protein YkoI
MKKQILFTASTILLLASCKEFEIATSDVPKELITSFKTKYPNAQNVKWEVEKEKGKFYYEAEWNENGKKIEVHIAPDGSISPGN